MRIFDEYMNILKCMYSPRLNGRSAGSGASLEAQSTLNTTTPSLIRTLETSRQYRELDLACARDACTCKAGYGGDTGRWNCTVCVAGKYKSEADNGNCTDCGAGTYSQSILSEQCHVHMPLQNDFTIKAYLKKLKDNRRSELQAWWRLSHRVPKSVILTGQVGVAEEDAASGVENAVAK